MNVISLLDKPIVLERTKRYCEFLLIKGLLSYKQSKLDFCKKDCATQSTAHLSGMGSFSKFERLQLCSLLAFRDLQYLCKDLNLFTDIILTHKKRFVGIFKAYILYR